MGPKCIFPKCKCKLCEFIHEQSIKSRPFNPVYTAGRRPTEAFKTSYTRQNLIRAPCALIDCHNCVNGIDDGPSMHRLSIIKMLTGYNHIVIELCSYAHKYLVDACVLLLDRVIPHPIYRVYNYM